MNQQIAEIALSYHTNTPVEEMPEVTSPQQAVELLRSTFDPDGIQLKEEFVVLLLNNSKRCLGWSRISSGGATATIVDPAAIFQVAILANVQSIILANNYPSGNLECSPADRRLTERIVEAGKMLGIAVDDHIIITAEGHVSFKAKGLIE